MADRLRIVESGDAYYGTGDENVITHGDDVLGSDNKKIGTIKYCEETFCQIDTGFLGLGPDYYIPVSAIADVRPNQVFLNVPSDQLKQMGWDHPVSETSTTMGSMASGSMASTPREDFESTSARQDIETARGDVQSIPLEEEQLRAQKQTQQSGEVRVGKDVVEREQSMNVPVSHEEAIVRERRVDRPADHPIGEAGEEIRVPLSEERVDVSKEARVYGEVEVEKRRVTDQQQVSDTVRKEVPKVDKEGKVIRSESDEDLKHEEDKS